MFCREVAATQHGGHAAAGPPGPVRSHAGQSGRAGGFQQQARVALGLPHRLQDMPIADQQHVVDQPCRLSSACGMGSRTAMPSAMVSAVAVHSSCCCRHQPLSAVSAVGRARPFAAERQVPSPSGQPPQELPKVRCRRSQTFACQNPSCCSQSETVVWPAPALLWLSSHSLRAWAKAPRKVSHPSASGLRLPLLPYTASCSLATAFSTALPCFKPFLAGQRSTCHPPARRLCSLTSGRSPNAGYHPPPCLSSPPPYRLKAPPWTPFC